MFLFFGQEECRILAPHPGIEPVLSVLAGEVLTAGQGKRLVIPFLTISRLKGRCWVKRLTQPLQSSHQFFFPQ